MEFRNSAIKFSMSPEKSRSLAFILLIAFIYIPGIRDFVKYTPGHSLIVGSILLFINVILLSYTLLSKKIKIKIDRLFNFKIAFILILIFSVIILILYPIADGLKTQMRGSDEDDCVIMGVLSLSRGVNPYIERTYAGNPCSTGPGLLILYMPFVLARIYELGSVAFLITAAYCFKFSGPSGNSRIFVLLMLAGIFFWDLAVVGSDLIVVGCGLVISCSLIPRYIESKNTKALLFMACFVGLLASSRVNMLVFSPLYSMFIFMRWKRGGILFLFVSAVVALVPGAIIYFWSPEQFTPFHLIGKAGVLLPRSATLAAAGLSVAAALASAYGFRIGRSSMLSGIYFSLLPQFCALALAQLLRASWDFGLWEGANYLMPLIPVACALAVQVLFYCHDSDKEKLVLS